MARRACATLGWFPQKFELKKKKKITFGVHNNVRIGINSTTQCAGGGEARCCGALADALHCLWSTRPAQESAGGEGGAAAAAHARAALAQVRPCPPPPPPPLRVYPSVIIRLSQVGPETASSNRHDTKSTTLEGLTPPRLAAPRPPARAGRAAGGHPRGGRQLPCDRANGAAGRCCLWGSRAAAGVARARACSHKTTHAKNETVARICPFPVLG